MKKLLVILTILLCCSAFEVNAQMVYAVGSESPVSTQLADVRYEFIQSQLNSNLAFLVDKYTGNVWKYKNKKKGFETIERKNPDMVDTTKVNYQLYMSAEISSMCFLLNVHTGEMWRYISVDGNRTFEKIEMPWDVKKEE
jgi:hypothetical protein